MAVTRRNVEQGWTSGMTGRDGQTNTQKAHANTCASTCASDRANGVFRQADVLGRPPLAARCGRVGWAASYRIAAKFVKGLGSLV
jgi:hypothetical protein